MSVLITCKEIWRRHWKPPADGNVWQSSMECLMLIPFLHPSSHNGLKFPVVLANALFFPVLGAAHPWPKYVSDSHFIPHSITKRHKMALHSNLYRVPSRSKVLICTVINSPEIKAYLPILLVHLVFLIRKLPIVWAIKFMDVRKWTVRELCYRAQKCSEMQNSKKTKPQKSKLKWYGYLICLLN